MSDWAKGKTTAGRDQYPADPREAVRAAAAPAPGPAGGRCKAAGLRVLLAARMTAMTAPGGGETQLHATHAALCQQGVEARLWRPWEDDFSAAEVLHLFGSAPELVGVAHAARRRGLRVVVSSIAWFDLASLWSESGGVLRRAAGCGKFLLRAACPALPSWRRRLYHAADLVLPNSKGEARQLGRHFGLAADKLHVVPNAADPRFATADPRLFVEAFGVQNFVLYAGRIEPRKNQLGLLQALRGSGIPIVLLGDVVPGEEAYARACRAAADEGVLFVGRLPHDSPILASAYAACGCLALCSWYETPGLVALEAAMSGTPLVLTCRGCASEYFGELAAYVEPGDRAAIRRAVIAALSRGRDQRLAALVRQNFTWAAAAEATIEAYVKVCERQPGG
jgi:glycosyltransferase involved in cell wall biosynthesis